MMLTKTMRRGLLPLVACAVAAVLVGARSQAATPPAAQSGPGAQPAQPAQAPMRPAGHEGWTRMFNGVNLDGWDGPKDLWRVEDGAIVVRSVAEPPTGSVYLIWQGGQPKDFELMAEVKLAGEGANSGIQFRAALLGEVPGNPRTRWESRGYQFDIINSSGAGNIIECCRGPRRGTPPRPNARAPRGQMARSGMNETDPGELLGTIGDPAALRAAWKTNEWNRVHLIARGRTITTLVNGQVMAVLIDDHPTMFNERGYVAIQLEGRGANTAWFKDLWIKQLP